MLILIRKVSDFQSPLCRRNLKGEKVKISCKMQESFEPRLLVHKILTVNTYRLHDWLVYPGRFYHGCEMNYKLGKRPQG